MAKATKKQFEKALAECGATLDSQDHYDWIGWDLVVDAPEGMVFASSGGRTLISNGWQRVGNAYAELIADMKMGVREPEMAEKAGW